MIASNFLMFLRFFTATVLVLVLALEIMNEEAQPLGLTINWAKTKIQTTDVTVPPGTTVQVGGSNVEVVDTFTYLGSQLHSSGHSGGISRNCMQMLDRHIWRSMISLSTKLRLYNVYILPVFLYGAETWSITKAIEKRIDAFDQWCLRRILNITWSERVTNFEVRRRTGQPLLSGTVRTRRLKLSGHVARAH